MNALLEALASAPKPFKVVTTVAYQDTGETKTREVPCHSLRAAENHADFERRKIGRELLEQPTDRPVRVTSVEVVPA